MSFRTFQDKVNALIRRAGGNLRVSFNEDDDRFFANVSDGTVIIGRTLSPEVTIRWNGRSHQSVATI